jgi:hypothetical protein
MVIWVDPLGCDRINLLQAFVPAALIVIVKV